MEFLRSGRPEGLHYVCFLLMAAGCSSPPAPLTLSVAGRSSAHVSLASSGPFVAAVWAASTDDGVTDVYAATSRDGGKTFGEPVDVSAGAGDVRVNGEQPPRITLISRTGGVPDVAVIWTATGNPGTRLFTASSRDGGLTFDRAQMIAGTGAPGNRGWEAIGNDGRHVYAVWLDHRQLAPKEPGAGHQHGSTSPSAAASADGVAMAQLSQLYFAPIDGEAAPRPLTGGVCYCCKTAIASAPDQAGGALYLAWRHVYPGNLRDIAFSASRDGGATFSAPVRISEDQWAINGCPDDGPAMVVDADGAVHVVWPTVVNEGGEPTKSLFHAVSRDGRTFEPRTRIPAEGHANHPQLALAGDGALVVAWDESGSGTRHIAWARGAPDADGRLTFVRHAVPEGQGVYPVVAGTPDGALLAWTSGDPATSGIRLAEVP